MANKFKGRKYYGIVSTQYSQNCEYINWCSGLIEKAKTGLKDTDDLLVELTVTRVFTREKDLKEIENEI